MTERVLSPRETFSPSAAARPARRDRTVPFLLGIVALGAALRLFRLGARPLGGDEGFSWMWTHLPHPALWGAAARFEYNPPLFYSLQRLWLAFGDSEAALRSLPALLGVLLLPLVFWIGRATSGGRTGLLAALLAATSAPLVAYSQEARMYSFLCLVAALAVLGQVLFLRTWTDPRRWPGREDASADPARARVSGLAAYAAGTTLALYTHNTAVFLPLLANLVAVYWWLAHAGRSRRFAAAWIAANLLPLALWSWWLPTLLTQAADPAHNALQDFVQPSLARVAFRTARLYADWYVSADGSPLQVAVPVSLLALLGAWAWRDRQSALVLLAFAAGVPLVAYLVGLVLRPVWQERVVLWSVPLGLVLVAAGIETFATTRLRALVLGVVLTAQAASLAGYYAIPRKEPMDEATRAIAAAFAPGDAVVVYPAIEAGAFAYYARRAGLPGRHYVLPETPLLPGHPRVEAVQGQEAYVNDLDGLRATTAGHRRLWVLARSLGMDHPKTFPAEVATLGRVVDRRAFHPYLRLYLVEVAGDRH